MYKKLWAMTQPRDRTVRCKKGHKLTNKEIAGDYCQTCIDIVNRKLVP